MAEAIVICPSCGKSLAVKVRLLRVEPGARSLHVTFHSVMVEHQCEEN